MAYVELLSRLYRINQFKRVKLVASNVTRLHDALGRPFDAMDVVHVAGTNGKGSVCWKVHEACSAAGLRSALFVSPHLSSFRERARVGAELIPEDEVVRWTGHVMDTAARYDIEPSFFEITTMAAACHFRSAGVQLAVLEVGLGGRLDATNVCRPAVSAITSIGMDHVRILGPTVLDIAREKAGIIKPGVPVVVGPQREAGVGALLARCAHARRAPLVDLSAKVVAADGGPCSFDDENSLTARAVLEQLRTVPPVRADPRRRAFYAAITDADIDAALLTRPPCRVEHRLVAPAPGHDSGARHAAAATAGAGPASAPPSSAALDPPRGSAAGVTVVLDGAHNPPGVAALWRSLTRWPPSHPAAAAGRQVEQGSLRAAPAAPTRLRRVHLVVGAAADKDLRSVATAWAEVAHAGPAAADPAGACTTVAGVPIAAVHVVQADHPRAKAARHVAKELGDAMGWTSAASDAAGSPRGGPASPPVYVHEGPGSVRQGVVAAVLQAAGAGGPVDLPAAPPGPLATEQGLPLPRLACSPPLPGVPSLWQLVDAREQRDVVVVCGSLFIMPEARAAVGIVEPRDPPSLVAASVSPEARDAR